MGKNVDFDNVEADPVSPEEADRKGKVNIVKGIIDDPEVQGIIKKSILKETITSGLVMACFFLGMFKLYDVAKTVFNFNWVVDLIVGLVLTIFSLSYMLKNFKRK